MVQRTVSCVFVKTKRGGSSRYAYAGVLRSYWRRFGDRVLHCFDASHVYLKDRFFTHERNQSDHPRQVSRPPPTFSVIQTPGKCETKNLRHHCITCRRDLTDEEIADSFYELVHHSGTDLKVKMLRGHEEHVTLYAQIHPPRIPRRIDPSLLGGGDCRHISSG